MLKNSKSTLSVTALKEKELSLDEVALVGAQEMIRIALEAELNAHFAGLSHIKTGDGRPALVRNGYNPTRDITIGQGQISVGVPRTRKRTESVENYSSAIVPKYMRRSLKIDEAIPLLYLKGISTGNMYCALEKLLGDKVSGLSASNVTRLKKCWKEEYDLWRKRDLSDKKYCYLWVDGVHTNVRFSDNRLCNLVVIGATEGGEKELVAVESGYRESKESWLTLLRKLRNRGMTSPKLAIGDGAMGFWQAVKEIFPETKHQRCWVHKVRNVLDKMPKSVQAKAKDMLNEIQMAKTRKDAEKAFDEFIEVFGDKYYKAVKCLKKDRKELLAFYDYPAKHWKHIRTTNPIESTFATVRLRTKSTRGHGTEETTFMMVYKLLEQASKRWQKMWGYKLIPLVLNDVIFVDGEEMNKAA